MAVFHSQEVLRGGTGEGGVGVKHCTAKMRSVGRSSLSGEDERGSGGN